MRRVRTTSEEYASRENDEQGVHVRFPEDVSSYERKEFLLGCLDCEDRYGFLPMGKRGFLRR
jgi:hypothetical protein